MLNEAASCCCRMHCSKERHLLMDKIEEEIWVIFGGTVGPQGVTGTVVACPAAVGELP